MQIERCKVCGGSINNLGLQYMKCEYCGQIYDLNGNSLSDNQVYKDAIEIQEQGTEESIEQSRHLFEGILDFKDSANQAILSYASVEKLKIAEEENRLKEEREHQIDLEKERLNKIKTKKFALMGAVVAVISVLILIVFSINANMAKKADMYNKAMDYYNAEDYESAIGAFSKILDYSDSKEYLDKSAEMILQEIDELISKGEFEEAKRLLTAINENCSSYSQVSSKLKLIEEGEMHVKYEKAVELYSNGDLLGAQKTFLEIKGYEDVDNYLSQIGEKVYEEAVFYYEKKEYESFVNAIDAIDTDSEWTEYDKAVTLLQNAKDEYKNSVETNAIQILHGQGYNDFSNYVKGMQNVLYSKTDVDSFIKKNKPVYLMDLDTYAESGYIHVDKDYSYFTGFDGDVYKDNLGNTYSFGMNRRVPNYSMEESYIEFRVSDYNYLSGILILNYECRSREEAGYMRVYGDGSLLYTSPGICKGFDPKQINIDISGVNVIRFEFDGDYTNPSFVEPCLLK